MVYYSLDSGFYPDSIFIHRLSQVVEIRMASGSIVDVSETDARFLRRLSTERGAEKLKRCFQCGVCVSSCPVRVFEPSFSPRRIIKMAKLGLKDQVLGSEFVWFCSMCFLCDERCPQDVRPPEVMTVLRNMAVAEGKTPPSLQKLLELLARAGRVYPLDDFISEERTDKGLPEVDPEPAFVKKIAEAES